MPIFRKNALFCYPQIAKWADFRSWFEKFTLIAQRIDTALVR